MDTQLRDKLALDRTMLALERTILAYARTALAFVASGVSVLHFLPSDVALVGWTLIVAAFATSVFGTWRFVKVRRDLRGAGP